MTYCNAVRNLYPGAPPQVDFTITFEYQDRADVKVALWDANQTTPPTREYVLLTEYDGSNTQPAGHYYQWQNATTIRFVTELGANDPPPVPTADPTTGDTVDNVLLFRLTDVDPARAIFAPGSSIRAQDLNDNFEQLAMGIEESRCLIERLGDEADLFYWNKFDDTDYSTEPYQGDDLHIASNAMNEEQFATFVQTTPPDAQGVVGKTWYVDDSTQQLYIWNGSAWKGVKASTEGDTIYDNVWFVSPAGDDINNGHSVTRAKRTIKNSVDAALAEGVDNALIFVFPGVYNEDPITIQASNLSIVGQAIRSCFIHPKLTDAEVAAYDINVPVGNELNTMFLCDNGTYISGFTIAGIKAAGTRGDAGSIDPDATYGLPPQQGWVAAFRPGCTLRKSPYIQNCTVFSDARIDNRPPVTSPYPDGGFGFDPNNLAGQGVAPDTSSAPTGGGILCDGNTPVATSPLKSFVVDSFTQINLDGPGILCTNNGYAQLVSFFGTFCHYHAKAINGGQLNLSNCTTDFGRYGLIADGISSTALITGELKTAVTGYTKVTTPSLAYTAGTTKVVIEDLTAAAGWTSNQPGETYMMEVVYANEGLPGELSDFYSIASTGIASSDGGGVHNFVSATTNAISQTGTPIPVEGATYVPTTGILTVTSTGHGLANGSSINFQPNGFTFTCDGDGNNALKTYPRTTDPKGQTPAATITVVDVDTFTCDVGISAPANAECLVEVLSPQPGAAATNLGFYRDYPANTTVRFYRRSYISTGGHTFEFVGSGTDYDAHPDYGGIPIQSRQVIQLGGEAPVGLAAPKDTADPAHWATLNGGRVWYSSTDENGRFQVGSVGGNDFFVADQKTGVISVGAGAVSINIVNDLNPTLGNDLDVNAFRILGDRATAPAYSGVDGSIVMAVADGPGQDVQIAAQSALKIPAGTTPQRPTTTLPGHIRFNTQENLYEGYYPAPIDDWQTIGGLAPGDVGTNPNQIPLNQMLGQMAFVDNVATLRPYSNTSVQPVFPGEVVIALNADGTSLTFRARPFSPADPTKPITEATITLTAV